MIATSEAPTEDRVDVLAADLHCAVDQILSGDAEAGMSSLAEGLATAAQFIRGGAT